jgi:hypothetical protein
MSGRVVRLWGVADPTKEDSNMNVLRKLAAVAAVVLATASTPAHAGGISVGVNVGGFIPPMPPVPVVVRPPMPIPGAVWMSGSWGWNGVQWVWTNGYWQNPQPVVVGRPYGGYYGGGYYPRPYYGGPTVVVRPAPVVVQRPVYSGGYARPGYGGGYARPSYGGGYAHPSHGGGYGGHSSHGHGHR